LASVNFAAARAASAESIAALPSRTRRVRPDTLYCATQLRSVPPLPR
jgi:hypothetical protein